MQNSDIYWMHAKHSTRKMVLNLKSKESPRIYQRKVLPKGCNMYGIRHYSPASNTSASQHCHASRYVHANDSAAGSTLTNLKCGQER